MVNVFNDKVAEEGKNEVVEAGDPDGTLFLINPDVSFITPQTTCLHPMDKCLLWKCLMSFRAT